MREQSPSLGLISMHFCEEEELCPSYQWQACYFCRTRIEIWNTSSPSSIWSPSWSLEAVLQELLGQASCCILKESGWINETTHEHNIRCTTCLAVRCLWHPCVRSAVLFRMRLLRYKLTISFQWEVFIIMVRNHRSEQLLCCLQKEWQALTLSR